MRGVKMVMAMLAAGSLALGGSVALAATSESRAPEASKTTEASKATPAPVAKEKETAPDRIVRGEVTSVDAGAKTLTVKALRSKETETVGVEVPDTVKITQGKMTKTLGDIKVGDRVWMKYDRMSDKLVADQIRILKSGPMAAKGETSKKSY